MPWVTPSLSEVRTMARDHVMAKLPGADALLPNSVVRVMADAVAGLAHLNLQFIDWLALQVLPDTAAAEWLFRWGEIFGIPRKAGVVATGTVAFSGTQAASVPSGTRLTLGLGIEYETTEAVTLGAQPTPAAIRALDPGAAGNLEPGASLSFVAALSGVNAQATVVTLSGGADDEALENWRGRILARIRQPPHGGADHDYVAWARAVPGCTRVFVAANEMGIGTVTVRPLFDVLRASTNGFPSQEDMDAVAAAIAAARPVTVKEIFVFSPLAKILDFAIPRLDNDSVATRAAVQGEVQRMLSRRAAPGQTIYRSWVAEAVAIAAGEDSHDLTFDNLTCGPGEMAVLGSIVWPN